MSVYFDAVSDSAPIGDWMQDSQDLAQNGNTIFGFRFQFIILYAVIIVALVWFIWNKTKLENMFAIGGNIEAATVSGVNIVVTCWQFMYLWSLEGFGGALSSTYGSATNALDKVMN